MKKLLLFIICVTVSLAFCSCSGSVIQNVHNALDNEEWTYIDGWQVPVPDDVEYLKKGDFVIKSVGETISDYVVFSFPESDTTDENGVNGLYYTLNKVTVYDSITSAGLSYDDTNGRYSKENLEKYPFVLVDAKLEYKPIETVTEQLTVAWSLNELVFSDISYANPPGINYFSLHPKGTADDFKHDGNNYFIYKITSGEAIDVQIGIIVSRDCLENEDLYLTPHPVGVKLSGFTPECFKLIDGNTVFKEASTQ